MTTTKTQFDSVVEFMSVAGQAVNTAWTNPTTKVGKFRLRLIDEEMNGKNELFDSAESDNLEGILDGICDVLYVAYGAYATFGLDAIEQEIYNQIPDRTWSFTGRQPYCSDWPKQHCTFRNWYCTCT